MLSRSQYAKVFIFVLMQAQSSLVAAQSLTDNHMHAIQKAYTKKPRLIAAAGIYDKSIDNSIQKLLDKGNGADSVESKKDAISSYRQAISLLEQYRPYRKSELASALNSLGCLIGNNDSMLKESESLQQRALALTDDRDLTAKVTYTLNLASTKTRLNDLKGAELLYHQVLTLTEQSAGLKSTIAGIAYDWLAYIMISEAKYNEAEKYARLAVEILATKTDYDNYKSSALFHLADALCFQKKYVEAEGVYEQAIPSLKAAYGSDDLRLAYSYEVLGSIQKMEGKDSEAIDSWTKELTIRAKNADCAQVFDYREGAPNCEHYYKDGALYRKIKGNDFTVEVAYLWLADVSCMRVDLLVANNSVNAIDILPTNVKLVAPNQGRHEFQQVCVQKFQETTLKANTVAAGSSIVGTICFQSDNLMPPGTPVSLQIVIGKTTFTL